MCCALRLPGYTPPTASSYSLPTSVMSSGSVCRQASLDLHPTSPCSGPSSASVDTSRRYLDTVTNLLPLLAAVLACGRRVSGGVPSLEKLAEAGTIVAQKSAGLVVDLLCGCGCRWVSGRVS